MKHPKNEITKTQNGDTKLKAPEKTVTQNLWRSPSTQQLTQDNTEFISNDLKPESLCSKNLQNNINVQNSNNHTALDVAVSEGKLSQQKITIIPEADDAKADPNILDNDNKWTEQTPVDQSAQFYLMCKQQTLTAKEMVNFQMRIFSSLNFINQPDADGNTPLHLAIKADNQFATQQLISLNAKADIQDNDGKTALHYLAQKEKVYEMQQLIKKGTDLKNIQDKDGKTVLDDMESYSPEIKNLLNSADKIYANAQIHKVAEKGTVEEMKNLIAKGADINHRGPNDRTVLHVAVQNGNQEMVNLLIENNADIEATNNHGRTALYVAVEKGNHSMVEFLFNKGAKLDIQDDCQKPPLHVAASRDNKEVIIFLIKNGANVNQQDQYGQTSLHYAAQNRNPVIAECLIKNGANVNQQDKYGNTPLYYAIRTHNEPIVQYLINAGADLSITNNDGETYLQIAQTKGNQEIVQLLQNHSKKSVGDADAALSLTNTQNKLDIPENNESSASTKNTSWFSVISSFFRSFWSKDNSSNIGEGHSNNSPGHESNHSDESNTSWFSWLGSFFKGFWSQKVQDKSTLVQTKPTLPLHDQSISPLTTQNTSNDVTAKLIADLPNIAAAKHQTTTMGDHNSEEE